MVQQGRTRGKAQHGRLYTVLVWSRDLRGEEPSVDGDADGDMLGVAAVPFLEGSRG